MEACAPSLPSQRTREAHGLGWRGSWGPWETMMKATVAASSPWTQFSRISWGDWPSEEAKGQGWEENLLNTLASSRRKGDLLFLLSARHCGRTCFEITHKS